MTNVSFFKYTGKPNEVPKSLVTPVVTKQVNLITESFPCLNVTIELDTAYDVNYCTFNYPTSTSRSYKWFVNDIVKFEQLYRYELTLDVLCTYWDDFKTETQMIERSSSLTPTNIMVDTLWKTGKELVYNKYLSSLDEDDSPFKKTLGTNARHFILATAAHSGLNRTALESVSSGTFLLSLLKVSEMRQFSEWMWTTDALENFKKWFNNPSSAIISCMMFPFDMEIDSTQLEDTLFVGNLNTGVNCRIIRQANYTLQLGYIDFSSFRYNDFRDYSPYTSFKIWLPYIGMIDFVPDEFYTSNRVYVKYVINVLSGSVLVLLSASLNGVPHQIVSGKMGASVPITESGMAEIQKNLFLGAMNLAITAGAGVLANNLATDTSFKSQSNSDFFNRYDGTRKWNVQETDVFKGATWGSASNNATGERSYYTNNRPRVALELGGSLKTFMNTATKGTSVQVTGNLGGDIYLTQSAVPYILAYHTASIADTYQNTKYGKLVMEPHQISTLSGFCKICECNIPMKGLPVTVYETLVNTLESGFYINN